MWSWTHPGTFVRISISRTSERTSEHLSVCIYTSISTTAASSLEEISHRLPIQFRYFVRPPPTSSLLSNQESRSRTEGHNALVSSVDSNLVRKPVHYNKVMALLNKTNFLSIRSDHLVYTEWTFSPQILPLPLFYSWYFLPSALTHKSRVLSRAFIQVTHREPFINHHAEHPAEVSHYILEWSSSSISHLTVLMAAISHFVILRRQQSFLCDRRKTTHAQWLKSVSPDDHMIMSALTKSIMS